MDATTTASVDGKDTVDWIHELVDQLEFHWQNNLRPRLEGLTDEEYLWEPVPGCWSLRPRAEATTPMAAGAGDLVLDFESPEPVPAPVTTIAWRLGHILVGVLGMRVASHFGGPPVDYMTCEWPATASDALRALDDAYEAWTNGVRSLGLERLGDPIGPAEGIWAERTYLTLVLHINREVIHHGAEIALLRDLYTATQGRPFQEVS
jgi:hypothetical protein